MRIEPVPALDGHVAVPGDKSISHRAVLIGAMCEGETRVTGFGRSEDTEATMTAVRALGAEVVEDEIDTLTIRGVGLHGLRAPSDPIDCGNAGTLMRLGAGLLRHADSSDPQVGFCRRATRRNDQTRRKARELGSEWLKRRKRLAKRS